MQLLHEVVRPHCNRDDCGEVGEAMFQLADAIEVGLPLTVIPVQYRDGQPDAETWRSALEEIERPGLFESEDYALAIDRIRQLAGVDHPAVS